MSSNPKNDAITISIGMALGSGIGVALGTAIGAVTDNIGFWISMGISLGAAMGLAHAFKCVGKKTGKLLFWMTPGGYEQFFAAAAEAVGDGPPDMEKLIALGKAHDVDIIGPPIAGDG